MSEKKTAPALRLVTINSDESKVVEPTRTVALVNPDTGRFLTGVTATVRILSPEDVAAIELKHREPVKTATGWEYRTDAKAVQTALVIAGVVSWDRVNGADGKPIAPTPKVLAALDEYNRIHLAGVARTPADVIDAEVVEASFREPAGVAALAR